MGCQSIRLPASHRWPRSTKLGCSLALISLTGRLPVHMHHTTPMEVAQQRPPSMAVTGTLANTRQPVSIQCLLGPITHSHML